MSSPGHWDLLPKLAMAVGAAAIVDAVSSFANSQILGVAAQRAITDMRRTSSPRHAPANPLPDSTKSGVLIADHATDAEGIRNLVGTGLVQLTGSILTATIALGFLIYLNWKLTVVTAGHPRPVRRRDGNARSSGCGRCSASEAQINAEVTGRLAESPAAHRQGAHRREAEEPVRAGRASPVPQRRPSLTGVSSVTAFSSLVIAAIGIAMMLIGGSAIRAGQVTIGDFFRYSRSGDDHHAGHPAGVDRHQLSEAFAGSRPHPRDPADGDRGPGRLHHRGAAARRPRRDRVDDVTFEHNPGAPVLEARQLHRRRDRRPRSSARAGRARAR
jgi:subfamily B ATP-binding cassette protein MsbA